MRKQLSYALCLLFGGAIGGVTVASLAETEVINVLPPVRQGPPVGKLGSDGKLRAVSYKEQVDNVRIFAPKEIANVGSFKGAPGEIVTNVNRNRVYPETLIVSSETAIIDLYYTAYSRKFAKRFGWPAEYVVDMKDDVGMVNFRIKTEGTELSCRLGMFIKKDPKLNLPPRPFARHIIHGGGLMGFNFPTPDRVFPESQGEKLYRPNLGYMQQDYDYWMTEGGLSGDKSLEEYMIQNFFIYAGDTPPADEDFKGSLGSAFLYSYYPYYIRNYDYFELMTSCINLDELLSAEEFYVFIKNKGEGQASSQSVLRQEKSGGFKRFEVPKVFRDRARQAAKDIGPNYNNVVRAHWGAFEDMGLKQEAIAVE